MASHLEGEDVIDGALELSLAGDRMAGIGEALAARHVDARSASVRQRSDADLIVRVAHQDRAAFCELYDRYGAAAYRLADRITRNPQLAEAVVQDVFLTIWRRAGRFDERRARPATWLLTIVHHRAVDVVRGEQLRRTEPEGQIAELADESVDVPREAWLALQRDRVHSAVAALSDPQREVIELAYFKGYTQNQLAQHLGQPVGTIKSRTQAALARLRATLEREGFSAELAY
jgi:RNA polymerase sigma-70 factor (ECF subfamily)